MRVGSFRREKRGGARAQERLTSCGGGHLCSVDLSALPHCPPTLPFLLDEPRPSLKSRSMHRPIQHFRSAPRTCQGQKLPGRTCRERVMRLPAHDLRCTLRRSSNLFGVTVRLGRLTLAHRPGSAKEEGKDAAAARSSILGTHATRNRGPAKLPSLRLVASSRPRAVVHCSFQQRPHVLPSPSSSSSLSIKRPKHVRKPAPDTAAACSSVRIPDLLPGVRS